MQKLAFICAATGACVISCLAAGPNDSSVSKNRADLTSQPAAAPAISKKAEEQLKTTLKAKEKYVYDLLQQYKKKHYRPWPGKNRLFNAYSRLGWGVITSDELNALTRDVCSLIREVTAEPLKDKELFQAIYGMCMHAEANRWGSYFYLTPAFPELAEQHIDSLMNRVMNAKDAPQKELVLLLPLSVKTKRTYREFLKEQMAASRKKYQANIKRKPERAVFFKIIHLRECAYMGDAPSERELIALFKSLKWKHPSDSGARVAMSSLMRLGTRDCIVGVLSRFRENVGAPEYKISLRGDILQMLSGKYPDAPFFKKYKNYLAHRGLDSSIGGEEGVKTLYAEFRVWVKKQFDYDLNLQGADFKIRVTPPIDTFGPRPFKEEKEEFVFPGGLGHKETFERIKH